MKQFQIKGLKKFFNYSLLFGIVFFSSCKGKDKVTLSGKAVMTDFEVLGDKVAIEGKDDAFTVTAEVPANTDLTKLKPTFKISDKATSKPESGTVQDFSNPVKYVVTSQDKKKEITVTVTITVAAATQ